jgi:hypothetical protein
MVSADLVKVARLFKKLFIMKTSACLVLSVSFEVVSFQTHVESVQKDVWLQFEVIEKIR